MMLGRQLAALALLALAFCSPPRDADRAEAPDALRDYRRMIWPTPPAGAVEPLPPAPPIVVDPVPGVPPPATVVMENEPEPAVVEPTPLPRAAPIERGAKARKKKARGGSS